jgi:hypothetical protein
MGGQSTRVLRPKESRRTCRTLLGYLPSQYTILFFRPQVASFKGVLTVHLRACHQKQGDGGEKKGNLNKIFPQQEYIFSAEKSDLATETRSNCPHLIPGTA